MEINYEALIIGGSAGSLDVILTFLPRLKEDLKIPIILVLHRKSGSDNILINLLSKYTSINVKEIEEKEKLSAGNIYVTPPNYHLLIENDLRLSLDASEKINYSRPSIDVTFESAAQAFGENVVCILLSGANNDGTMGLKKVKEYGGLTIIQNPAKANVPYMPEFALQNVDIDRILDVDEIADFINNLT